MKTSEIVVAGPCATCNVNIRQALDHDSVECFETCKAFAQWQCDKIVICEKRVENEMKTSCMVGTFRQGC